MNLWVGGRLADLGLPFLCLCGQLSVSSAELVIYQDLSWENSAASALVLVRPHLLVALVLALSRGRSRGPKKVPGNKASVAWAGNSPHVTSVIFYWAKESQAARSHCQGMETGRAKSVAIFAVYYRGAS